MGSGSSLVERSLYSGHVQGVGFRYQAKEAAMRLGVAGWVRNLPDGRVEMVAKGDRRLLARLYAEIADRMSGHIRDVQRTPGSLPEDWDGFRIER